MLELVAVPCFCLAFLVGGYSLGRLSNPRRVWFELDPDPLRDSAEVVSLDAARLHRERLAS